MAQTDYTNPVKPETKKSQDTPSALLPKSIFPDGKAIAPGETCTVKVEKVYSDQVSVSYVNSEEPDLESELQGNEEDEMD